MFFVFIIFRTFLNNVEYVLDLKLYAEIDEKVIFVLLCIWNYKFIKCPIFESEQWMGQIELVRSTNSTR